MDNKILAQKLLTEVGAFPSFTQNLVKDAFNTFIKEVNEGKILIADLLESEDKFFDTIANMVDISTNTGIVDPFDFPYIRKFVERILRPILVRCFGDNWIVKLREIL